MSLTDAAVRPLVESWGASVAAPWTTTQVDAVVGRLTALSDDVTPHVVADVALPEGRRQELLVARVVDHLERWLARAAAPLRAAWDLDAVRPTAAGDATALGLRSATLDEIDALPGIGTVNARAIARLVTQDDRVEDLADLEVIDGIGPGRVEQLRAVAYLDRPRVGLVSPALVDFVTAPRVGAFLALLDGSGLGVSFGDAGTLARRGAGGGTPFERFSAFLDLVAEQAARSSSVASAVVASEALRRLDRHALRRGYLASVQPATGAVLVDASYVERCRALVDGAAASVHVMVFLGTAAASLDGLGPAPLTLIEGVEAAAARGLDVRVVLDQDDGGEPYGSALINAALVRRLQDHGVDVRLDREDTLLHSKVLVVDREHVVVGSHNWTRAALTGTHELSVLIDSPAVAADYADRFTALWATLPPLP